MLSLVTGGSLLSLANDITTVIRELKNVRTSLSAPLTSMTDELLDTVEEIYERMDGWPRDIPVPELVFARDALEKAWTLHEASDLPALLRKLDRSIGHLEKAAVALGR